MLKIRMSRGGTKKRPFFKIVVADARSPRDGRFIERLGHYNPLLPKDNPERIKIDLERVKHWLGHGAQPSDRIGRFLVNIGKRWNTVVGHDVTMQSGWVNGAPGIVINVDAAPYWVATMDVKQGRVDRVYTQLNPDKLGAIDRHVELL